MTDVEEPVEDIVAEEEAEEVEEDLEEEEEFVAVGATEVKLFGKWSFDDIEIRDISLEVSAVEVVWNGLENCENTTFCGFKSAVNNLRYAALLEPFCIQCFTSLLIV